MAVGSGGGHGRRVGVGAIGAGVFVSSNPKVCVNPGVKVTVIAGVRVGDCEILGVRVMFGIGEDVVVGVRVKVRVGTGVFVNPTVTV